MPFLHTIFVVMAVSAVAIADVLLRKTHDLGSLSKALVSPWMVGAILLYLFQIFFFTYLFVSGAKLVYIGVLQTVLYALIVILAGVFIFGETLGPIQIMGIVLALVGVILLNL